MNFTSGKCNNGIREYLGLDQFKKPEPKFRRTHLEGG